MQDLKPTVWIGKQGCTETMIEENGSGRKKENRQKIKRLFDKRQTPGSASRNV